MIILRILIVTMIIYSGIMGLFIAVNEKNPLELGKAAVQILGLVAYYELRLETKGDTL